MIYSDQSDEEMGILQAGDRATRLQLFLDRINQQLIEKMEQYIETNSQCAKKQLQLNKGHTNRRITLYEDIMFILEFKKIHKKDKKRGQSDFTMANKLILELRLKTYRKEITISDRIKKKLSLVSNQDIIDHIEAKEDFLFNKDRTLKKINFTAVKELNGIFKQYSGKEDEKGFDRNKKQQRISRISINSDDIASSEQSNKQSPERFDKYIESKNKQKENDIEKKNEKEREKTDSPIFYQIIEDTQQNQQSIKKNITKKTKIVTKTKYFYEGLEYNSSIVIFCDYKKDKIMAYNEEKLKDLLGKEAVNTLLSSVRTRDSQNYPLKQHKVLINSDKSATKKRKNRANQNQSKQPLLENSISNGKETKKQSQTLFSMSFFDKKTKTLNEEEIQMQKSKQAQKESLEKFIEEQYNQTNNQYNQTNNQTNQTNQTNNQIQELQAQKQLTQKKQNQQQQNYQNQNQQESEVVQIQKKIYLQAASSEKQKNIRQFPQIDRNKQKQKVNELQNNVIQINSLQSEKLPNSLQQQVFNSQEQKINQIQDRKNDENDQSQQIQENEDEEENSEKIQPQNQNSIQLKQKFKYAKKLLSQLLQKKESEITFELQQNINKLQEVIALYQQKYLIREQPKKSYTFQDYSERRKFWNQLSEEQVLLQKRQFEQFEKQLYWFNDNFFNMQNYYQNKEKYAHLKWYEQEDNELRKYLQNPEIIENKFFIKCLARYKSYQVVMERYQWMGAMFTEEASSYIRQVYQKERNHFDL